MLVVCCSLSGVCCLWFDVCGSLCVVACLLIVGCWCLMSLFDVCCVVVVVVCVVCRRSLSVVGWLLVIVVRSVLFVVG